MESGSRQLAAVWFADIVGYTTLSNRDESEALRLVDLFQEVTRSQVDRRGGRIVKFLGDGVLASSPSALVALETILGLREEYEARSANSGTPSYLRIGAHVGDVVFKEDGDVYGDGVNIASRLQGVAGPGRIFVSEDLWRHCRQRPELEFASLGPRDIKGVAEPVWVYEFSPPEREPRVGDLDASESSAGALSVAVLPFEIVGDSPNAGFLASGIHNDLLTELSKVPDLTVISRTSVMGYADTSKTIPVIARELNVSTVIEGVIQSAGNRVRLTVQMIDGQRDVHRWADYFDREVNTESLFDIQTELTARIARSLQLKLAPSKADIATGPGTENMEAYRLVVEGRMQFDRKTEDGFMRAIELFDRATIADPDYGEAWVGLSNAQAMMADYKLGDIPALLAAAKESVAKAAVLLPNSAGPHTTLGLIAEVEHDAPRALREYEKAIGLQPGHADAYSWHAWMSLVTGDAEAGLASATRSVRLNPLSAEAVSNLSLAHLAVGNPGSGVEEARRAGELSPGWTSSGYYEGLALYDLGRVEEAIAALRPLSLADAGELAVSWASMGPDVALALAHLKLGDDEAARGVLSTIDPGPHSFEAGIVHAGLDELDAAFDLFFQTPAVAYGPTLIFHHHFKDVWARLLDDPRYPEVVNLVYRSWNVNPARPGPDSHG
ncbi:MAG: adenylate/guanylate cyclase domain-containing protein [Acidimicrobiia bacterium]|nr:adenylate/guanylate cyclase domain-containing protein [Acidimicrobiia bacterium]